MTVNKHKNFAIQLGHCILHFSLTHSEKADNFNPFVIEAENSEEIIKTGDYEKTQYQEQFTTSKWDAYAENKCLLILASDAMMKNNQFIFHSAAVLINNQVWLLSGPSGIGKSTQYRNLKRLYSDNIDIISGDNPVLAFREDYITVYPSPWNGKENWGSMNTGKLSGIILLKQSDKNCIRPVKHSDAVIPIYRQIITYAKTEEQVHMLAALEEQLITSVPIWTFDNTGDIKSSQILYDHILNYESRR